MPLPQEVVGSMLKSWDTIYNCVAIRSLYAFDQTRETVRAQLLGQERTQTFCATSQSPAPAASAAAHARERACMLHLHASLDARGGRSPDDERKEARLASPR